VADQFVNALLAAGVKRVYGVVGYSLNGITDAPATFISSTASLIRHDR
jgi:thiamine pyrophosphate-dependent acetolactate synthase large subunit-like protein